MDGFDEVAWENSDEYQRGQWGDDESEVGDGKSLGEEGESDSSVDSGSHLSDEGFIASEPEDEKSSEPEVEERPKGRKKKIAQRNG